MAGRQPEEADPIPVSHKFTTLIAGQASEIFFLLCYNTVMDKSKFLKVYANLPINLRNDVILVLDSYGPITWNVAFIEIDNDTELGKIILEKLINLKIV